MNFGRPAKVAAVSEVEQTPTRTSPCNKFRWLALSVRPPSSAVPQLYLRTLFVFSLPSRGGSGLSFSFRCQGFGPDPGVVILIFILTLSATGARSARKKQQREQAALLLKAQDALHERTAHQSHKFDLPPGDGYTAPLGRPLER